MKAEEVLEKYQQKGIRKFWNSNLRGQSFEGQNLSQADFRGSQLQGANFEGAILQGVNFEGTELQGANFSKAKTGLSFIGKIFETANSLIFSLLLILVIPRLLSYFIQKLLENSLQENIYISIQQLLFFSAATLLIGFIITNLGKGIIEAWYFVCLITIAIFLTLFSQPVLLITAWLLVLAAIIVANKNLFFYPNKSISILISIILSILGFYVFLLLDDNIYPIEDLIKFVATIYFEIFAITTTAIVFIKARIICLTKHQFSNRIFTLIIVYLWSILYLRIIDFEIVNVNINYSQDINPFINSLLTFFTPLVTI
ncbi:MAG: pentapeptide repeat-containing protein [Cyanobacteria bacterium P01_G01_bin.39]